MSDEHSIQIEPVSQASIARLEAFSNGTDFKERYQRNGDNETIVIAKMGGVDAGYAILNKQPKYGLYQKLGAPEIQDVFVLPEFRKQGVATALIKWCEEEAKTDRCDLIGISVGVSAKFADALSLYLNLGYRPDGQGVTSDRQTLVDGDMVEINDDLCLMLLKSLT